MFKHPSYYVSQIHCRDACVMLVATALKKVEPASKTKPGDLATPGDAGESRPPHLEAYVFFLEGAPVKTPELPCVVHSYLCCCFYQMSYIQK